MGGSRPGSRIFGVNTVDCRCLVVFEGGAGRHDAGILGSRVDFIYLGIWISIFEDFRSAISCILFCSSSNSFLVCKSHGNGYPKGNQCFSRGTFQQDYCKN